MNLVIWIIGSIFCGYIVYSDAKTKSRNKEIWFLIGILFGIFGLVIYVIYDLIDSSSTRKKTLREPMKKPPELEPREPMRISQNTKLIISSLIILVLISYVIIWLFTEFQIHERYLVIAILGGAILWSLIIMKNIQKRTEVRDEARARF